MADPHHHAISSAKRYGGVPEDYLAVHRWFDQTKSAWVDQRHRAILHNTFGIELCIQVFGQVITRKDGREIPTRWIAEQHINEDCGFVPTLQDWLKCMEPEEWMLRGARKFSRTISLAPAKDQLAEENPNA
jgi:hypothetical protein